MTNKMTNKTSNKSNQKSNGEKLKFKAVITNCRYYSEDSHWGIYGFTTLEDVNHKLLNGTDFDFDFDSNEKQSKKTGEIVGNVQRLEVGSEYVLEVEVEYNKKYQKDQFKPLRVSMDLPTSQDQQKRFLYSILTPTQSNTLLAVYPNIVQDVIDNKHIDIALLHGIGEQTITTIKQKIVDNYILVDLLSMLSPYGISYNQIKKISQLNDNPILVKEMIEENPYVLTNIKGFGFNKVDGIALKLNKSLRVSKFRAREYIKYVLSEEAEGVGHTWVKRDFLLSKARKDVNECMDLIKAIIEEEEMSPTFLKVDGGRIGLLVNYYTERAILRELERINNADRKFNLPSKEEIQRIISLVEERQGFKLSDEQRVTVEGVNKKGNVVVISGFSGSGKTSSVKAIYNILEQCKDKHNMKPNILQIALSAKAAKRIKEVTNRPSMTMHRALGFDGSKFRRNEEEPLPQEVIVLDEFSMVNIQLTLSLLKAVKTGSMLFLVFDHAQLPSIGAGAVAYDLLECQRYNVSKYIQVHRQSQMSGILSDANKIRQNKSPISQLESTITTGELKDMTYFFRKSQEEINSLAIKYYLTGVEKYGVDNINIVTARKDTVLNSAESLNKIIQNHINPQVVGQFMENFNKTMEFRINDRVMHKVNNPDKGIFNGDTGIVIDITRDYVGDSMQDVLVVNYGMEYDDEGNETSENIVQYTKHDLNDLRLAYCGTVHAWQGSENKAIIVVLDSSAYTLLDSTMLYTAITRAKERCLLISDPNSFKTCIRENKTIVRNTYLKEMLKEVTNG